ncbi:hypothetical protein [Mycoplasma marinum]|nr:hypothetical protein [Mycoplasma marinum]
MIFVSGVKLRSLLFIIPLIFLPYTSFLISKFEHGYIYFSAIIIILLLISSFLNSSFINKISNFGLEEIKNSIYSHKKINPNVWISIFFIINIGLQYITAINILGYIKINWLELWVVITGGLLMLLLGILVKMNKINSSIFEITSGIIMLITLGISTLFLNHNKFVDRSSDLFFVVILILIFIIVNIIFASNSGFNTMSYIVFLISLSIMATSQFVITYVISSKNFNIFASNFLSVDMFSILIFSFCLGINIIFNIIILLKSSNNINNFVKRKVKNNE